jgi:hypothetical protein
MGAGIAAAIADKLLTPESYEKYQRFCATNGAKALGYTFYLDAIDGRLIANMFSQKGFDASGNLTDYHAMLNCFAHIRKLAAKKNRPVSIPAGIGCGIAGGDWKIVRFVIDNVFDGSGVKATIYHKDREITEPTAGRASPLGAVLHGPDGDGQCRIE